MGQYRFVGLAKAQIMDTPYVFTSYGQLVELPDEIAVHAMGGHLALIPAADFLHTDDEIKLHGRFERAGNPAIDPAFKEKIYKHWEVLEKYHADPPSILTKAPEVK